MDLYVQKAMHARTIPTEVFNTGIFYLLKVLSAGKPAPSYDSSVFFDKVKELIDADRDSSKKKKKRKKKEEEDEEAEEEEEKLKIETKGVPMPKLSGEMVSLIPLPVHIVSSTSVGPNSLAPPPINLL